MEQKTLDICDAKGTRNNIKDVVIAGNVDHFQLLFKASSKNQGWMKSTKAMEIPGVGCVLQVSTQQINPDGSNSIAEALIFVPSVRIVDDENNGRKIISL